MGNLAENKIPNSSEQTVPDSFAKPYPYFQPGLINYLPMLLFRRPIKSRLIFLLLVLSNQENGFATISFPTFFGNKMVILQKAAVAFWNKTILTHLAGNSNQKNINIKVTDCQFLQIIIFSNENYNNDG